MAEHYVNNNFKDKEDNKRQYLKGGDNPYPSPDTEYEPLQERFNFLEEEGFIAKKEQDLSKLKKDELLALAEKQGVEASDDNTKAEIIEKLEG